MRSRWAAIGAAVAVSLGAGGLSFAGAVTPTPNPVTTLIAPCRLMDTRAGGNIGPRALPLGPGETYTATVRGINGNCTIPAAATGVVMNVTIVNPTESSYLTVWPADKTKPNASALNWVGGQQPTPNQVTTALSVTDGKISLYNLAGKVDVIADVVGYLTPADLSQMQAQIDTGLANAAACKEFPHQAVDWHGCDLTGGNLSNANLSGAALTSATFQLANLSGADLTFIDATGGNLNYANLTGAHLHDATLINAAMSFAILTDADLSGAIMTNATLTNVTWSNTTCPDLTNSNSHANTCIGHL